MELKIGSRGLERVAVLGAAGKMGSGIALLILQLFAVQLARKQIEQRETLRLILIDANEDGFGPLKRYLKEQLKKYAERHINELRGLYSNRAELIDNSEMIAVFVEEAMDCLYFGTMLDECRGVTLVFEAIVEDVDTKARVFGQLNRLLGSEAYYFTNTSSIPIHILQEKSQLAGRLVGFHFYNPPAVQPLLEMILTDNTVPPLKTLAQNIAGQLKKIVVHANDVAGFIGNGHFIREAYFACHQVHALNSKMPLSEAIAIVNQVTQHFLLRPMGIFQLMDYVGIDVVQRIAKIMTAYLPESVFQDQLIDTMISTHVWGGQYSDGTQKDGFFHYKNGSPCGVFDCNSHNYISMVDTAFRNQVEGWLGKMTSQPSSWKILSKDPNRTEKISAYLSQLQHEETNGAILAKAFLQESQKIALGLVADGAARSIEDVDTVLMNGFFHLYGSNFFKMK